MLAFLFAGQGSQKVGMGAALAALSDDYQNTLHMADAALGYGLGKIMAEGPEEELRRTTVAQPALLTLTVAQARYLMAQGIVPDYLAGHSLGQYAALVIAGAITFGDCVRLVAERGRLMQETVPEGEGMMAAIVALDRSTVYEACAAASEAGIVDVACHNAPGQTVVSGSVAAVEAVIDYCEERDGGAVVLSVSAPFHCRLLTPMVAPFSKLLEVIPFHTPKLPVIDNVTARPLGDADAVRQSLIAQITSPVLFEESLAYMDSSGVDRFVECGPGKSLVAFTKRTVPHALVETFEQCLAKEIAGQ